MWSNATTDCEAMNHPNVRGDGCPCGEFAVRPLPARPAFEPPPYSEFPNPEFRIVKDATPVEVVRLRRRDWWHRQVRVV